MGECILNAGDMAPDIGSPVWPEGMFSGKHILIGMGGGIAVYRVAELVRLLIKQGANVRCVMTPAACKFVTPLTFEALTGETAHTELFNLTAEREMGHIQLARWADVLLVAPATADLIARFSHGICDHLLTTLFQVCEAPLLITPAMNVSMWKSAATQQNVAALKERGVHFIGPEPGQLACGEEGPGRMSEPETIVEAMHPLLQPQHLSGQRWLINAGPTWESWDDVRILTNGASGKLGACLANRAAAFGAEVTLVAGPGTPPTSTFVRRCNVVSAQEMLAACEMEAGHTDVFAATAAVSDYRFSEHVSGKLKRKHAAGITVTLDANVDIVAHIAGLPNRPRKIIAFAAEHRDPIEQARNKLREKKVDAIFANDISGMGKDNAAGWWLASDHEKQASSMSKQHLATWLIEQIMEMGA
ncbi:MAG: bifunctional phosphopantothenoylcysteine decarboxylase/phosphopantothenate--cysteine ligase CoaBC [Mariprofundaceae bacterium]|nr:bifunctional phosphopantothenoylcysteine decarboxylase/phosphopantothenate--cysteine ligase CoaBC [Mariprofundaceae bacterium]